MRSSCSTNDPTSQAGSGHTQRRLRHTTRTGRPNACASTRRTSTRPCPWTMTPHDRQPIGSAADSTVTISRSNGLFADECGVSTARRVAG